MRARTPREGGEMGQCFSLALVLPIGLLPLCSSQVTQPEVQDFLGARWGWAGPAEPTEPFSALGVLWGWGSASGMPAPGGFLGRGKAAAELEGHLLRGKHLMAPGFRGKGGLAGDKASWQGGQWWKGGLAGVVLPPTRSRRAVMVSFNS